MHINPLSPFKQMILVDENDNQIGLASKEDAHENGLLHRAVSIFMVKKNSSNELEILLQKRHQVKYHSGGLWSNTACTHPQPGENTKSQAELCLLFETGIFAELEEIATVTYRAEFDNGLIENEIDHVFYGFFDREIDINDIKFNEDEVSAMKFMTFDAIEKDLIENPSIYTAWLKITLDALKSHVEKE